MKKYNIPAKMLKFGRTFEIIKKFNIDLGGIEVVDLMGYNDMMEAQHHCKFMISDSGTAHEEPALLNTPVISPRKFTERPQSIRSNCSFLINTDVEDISWDTSHLFLEKWWNKTLKPDTSWLGDGTTSKRIVKIMLEQ
jgi:UDP-GlcNAc3NAcA epimerase